MRTTVSSLLVSCLVLSLAAVGCTEEKGGRPRDGGIEGADGSPVGTCAAGRARFCLGTEEVSCNPDGTESGRRDCSALSQTCTTELGCVTCVPGRTSCNGNEIQRCREDGSGYETVSTCDLAAGESCTGTGVCVNLCAEAAESNSYIGCEYWPVTSANSVSSSFTFAAVVSNPQNVPATVTVTRGSNVLTRTVAPSALEVIELPWVTETKDASNGSRLVRGGSYRLTSTVPVTVYQFNPLEYRIDRDCPEEAVSGDIDGQCFSFTNDASLLLPSHVLTSNYVVTALPTHQMRISVTLGPTELANNPGFFTVVAAEPGETQVTIQFAAHVMAASDNSVTAYSAGSTGTFTLQQGDLLQILSAAPPDCDVTGSDSVSIGLFVNQTFEYCRVGAEYDLTGSEIRATQRVAVSAGHNCTFLPANRWACDHVEEQLFPEEAWGRDAFVSITRPLRNEPNVVRIVSGRDGNVLTFEPASAHASVTLARGEVLEFEASNSFRVEGTEAIQVAQFLVGQDYAGRGTSGEGGMGDPAMSLAIPSDQFRTSYAFLAPTTFEQNYVNVTAPMSATITLDGAPVTDFTPIGTTGFGVAQVSITGGAHQIEGSAAFGIVVYGFGSYTSYMYPGGLDLEEINILF